MDIVGNVVAIFDVVGMLDVAVRTVVDVIGAVDNVVRSRWHYQCYCRTVVDICWLVEVVAGTAVKSAPYSSCCRNSCGSCWKYRHCYIAVGTVVDIISTVVVVGTVVVVATVVLVGIVVDVVDKTLLLQK